MRHNARGPGPREEVVGQSALQHLQHTISNIPKFKSHNVDPKRLDRVRSGSMERNANFIGYYSRSLVRPSLAKPLTRRLGPYSGHAYQWPTVYSNSIAIYECMIY